MLLKIWNSHWLLYHQLFLQHNLQKMVFKPLGSVPTLFWIKDLKLSSTSLIVWSFAIPCLIACLIARRIIDTSNNRSIATLTKLFPITAWYSIQKLLNEQNSTVWKCCVLLFDDLELKKKSKGRKYCLFLNCVFTGKMKKFAWSDDGCDACKGIITSLRQIKNSKSQTW